jgi:hypothetical protein
MSESEEKDRTNKLVQEGFDKGLQTAKDFSKFMTKEQNLERIKSLNERILSRIPPSVRKEITGNPEGEVTIEQLCKHWGIDVNKITQAYLDKKDSQ